MNSLLGVFSSASIFRDRNGREHRPILGILERFTTECPGQYMIYMCSKFLAPDLEALGRMECFVSEVAVSGGKIYGCLAWDWLNGHS